LLPWAAKLLEAPLQLRRKNEYKVLKAVAAGVLVWLASFVAHLTLLPIDRTMIARQIIANSIGGLVAVIVVLAIQLRHEESHYQTAMERAALVAELNHHVRNAIFPMHIAVMRIGDAEAKKIADEAVERINIALKDATTDALARRVDYSVTSGSSETLA
jgi:hypothetical protein